MSAGDIYSNRSARDLVRNPFDRLTGQSTSLWLAAPYFTGAAALLAAAEAGKPIRLLVGLNAATSPESLARILKHSNANVRYLTYRFHAKIYVFDDGVLLGSSNLTDGGLVSNREATILLDPIEDADRVEAAKALYAELWESGRVLTKEVLDTFRLARAALAKGPDPDREIEKAIGRVEPANINVASKTTSRERLFVDGLQHLVYEQYRPDFSEVAAVLEEDGLRREDLRSISLANESNRFLSWVRLTHAPGDEWREAPLRSAEERRPLISSFAREWKETPNSRVTGRYFESLDRVERVFGSPQSIESASQGELVGGLMALHAFLEQLRFVKGGEAKLPAEFWSSNANDVPRVKRTLIHLTHGTDELVQRLHDLLYDRKWKLSYFGLFSALELYGTLKPEECPPMNGRMAKVLRYFGFEIGKT